MVHPALVSSAFVGFCCLGVVVSSSDRDARIGVGLITCGLYTLAGNGPGGTPTTDNGYLGGGAGWCGLHRKGEDEMIVDDWMTHRHHLCEVELHLNSVLQSAKPSFCKVWVLQTVGTEFFKSKSKTAVLFLFLQHR